MLDTAVRFFILNRLSFSGCVDSGGYSPSAMRTHWTDSAIMRIEAITPIVQRAQITCEDYRNVVSTPGEDVFLFLDPPYASNPASKLYGTRGNLHTNFNHERLAETLKHTSHRWLLTYDDTPQIRALYAFAEIRPWELQYTFHTQKKPPKGAELMIKNY